MKNKTALVLEGGGMRGAYTSGALAWLLDNNIEFDNAYGISTGAVHLCSYLMKNKEYLHDFPVYHITNKNFIGIIPILRCFKIVDNYYLFQKYLPEKCNYSLEALKSCKVDAKIGVYECEKGKTEYIPVQKMSLLELQASTTLPLIGKVATVNKDRHIMDGGITEMIPVNQAVKDGCNKCLIIATKPQDYVRKPAKKIVVKIMKLFYPKWQSIGDDYEVRHLNYVKQINTIKDLQEKDNALYISPSKHSNVTRLGGSIQELQELYDLGYSDMENRKEEIFKLLK